MRSTRRFNHHFFEKVFKPRRTYAGDIRRKIEKIDYDKYVMWADVDDGKDWTSITLGGDEWKID